MAPDAVFDNLGKLGRELTDIFPLVAAAFDREWRADRDHEALAPLFPWRKHRNYKRPGAEREFRRHECRGGRHTKEIHEDALVPDDIDIDRQTQHARSEEHTSELQSPCNLVCRLLLEK